MKTTWPGFLLGPLGAKVPQTRRFCQKVRTVTPIRFVSKLRFLFGGEGGIRTLDTLVGYTRFPIVRARPATRLLHALARFVPPRDDWDIILQIAAFVKYFFTFLKIIFHTAGCRHWR